MRPLDRLNALPAAEARAELLACCGSREWARRMAERRPFASLAELLEEAERIWWELDESAWREAFAAHPRIGERRSSQPERGRRWSAEEQAGVDGAAEAVRAALAEGNRVYEARFGHTYIVCATGRSAEEMLVLLHERLTHPPDAELRTAAEEQRKITRLRLEKLLEP